MGLYATFATPDHSFLAVSLFTRWSHESLRKGTASTHTIVAIRAVACIVQLSNLQALVKSSLDSVLLAPRRWESCLNPEFATTSCLLATPSNAAIHVPSKPRGPLSRYLHASCIILPKICRICVCPTHGRKRKRKQRHRRSINELMHPTVVQEECHLNGIWSRLRLSIQEQ